MAGGTMNWADIYGEPASPIQIPSPISAAGPNQSFVNPAFSGPGTLNVTGGRGPAISLLGLVAALILLRVAVAMGGDVA